MADIWVGKDEAEGIPVPPRKDVAPPPHWRLEAVAATEVANARRGEVTSPARAIWTRPPVIASRSVRAPSTSRTAAPSSENAVRSPSIASRDAAPAAPAAA